MHYSMLYAMPALSRVTVQTTAGARCVGSVATQRSADRPFAEVAMSDDAKDAEQKPDYQILGDRMLDMLQGSKLDEAMAILGHLMTAVLNAYPEAERAELMASWLRAVARTLQKMEQAS